MASPAFAKPVGGADCLQLVAILPAALLPEIRAQLGAADPDAADAPVMLIETLKRLAGEGNAKAVFSLAMLEINGYCIERDLASAQHHVLQSAEAGDETAQRFLAANYERGPKAVGPDALGLETDRVQALKWYFVLDARKEQFAPKDIERLKPSLTPEQVRFARSQADDWIAAHPAAMAAAAGATR